jgi:hypothetical protein
MRVLSSAWPCAGALLGLLIGCEPMPSSGNPFAPAAAARPSEPAPDPRFDRPEPKVYTSEELHAQAKAAAPASPAPASGVITVSSGDPVGGPAASAPATPAPEPAPVAAPASASAPVAAAPTTTAAAMTPAPRAGGGWPMRLVRALPDTNPPRAILGLPDGREVVVSPGTMLPEHGIVVMAVGRDRLQVARIDAAGDHAAVTELSLEAQY